jgi:hypothetical protein
MTVQAAGMSATFIASSALIACVGALAVPTSSPPRGAVTVSAAFSLRQRG